MLLGSQLKHNTTHLFIASNKWSAIEIDLSDDIPRNVLPYITKNQGDIAINFDEPISQHQMKLLCELYPEIQGCITRTFLKKDDLHDLLSKMRK